MVRLLVQFPNKEFSLPFLSLGCYSLTLASSVTHASPACGPRSCMDHGPVDPMPYGLQLGAQAELARDWSELYCGVRLWVVILTRALLTTKNGTFPWWYLGGNFLNVTSLIKLSTIAHPPVGASGNSCSHRTPRSPLPPVTGGNTEDTPLIALLWATLWTKIRTRQRTWELIYICKNECVCSHFVGKIYLEPQENI